MDRVVLAVKYTAVSAGVRRNVGAFLKYVQHRDQHPGPREPKVDGLLRYVSHRDRSAGKGNLFSAQGTASDAERKQLTTFIARSVRGLPPRTDDRAREHRAAYRFVVSPEHADGLDLRQLTRTAMAQLAVDAGGIGPWIAAEHRNTKHPHVHIVLAARREVSPGRYRTVLLTRSRLQRMKEVLAREVERKHGRSHEPALLAPGRAASRRRVGRGRRRQRLPVTSPLNLTLSRLARHYQRELERELERREHEWEVERER